MNFLSALLAGMPGWTLTDVGAHRLNTISFFGMGLLLSAFMVKLLWNWLRSDFPNLPLLNYRKALGLTVLWGLLFVIVLTMISGARELMTPAAWEKKGLTYKLKNDNPEQQQAEVLTLRREKLQALSVSLMRYAAGHAGKFPDAPTTENEWVLPTVSGLRYLYRPGLTINSPQQILAYEPNVHTDAQLVLMTTGEVQSLTAEEVTRQLTASPQTRSPDEPITGEPNTGETNTHEIPTDENQP